MYLVLLIIWLHGNSSLPEEKEFHINFSGFINENIWHGYNKCYMLRKCKNVIYFFKKKVLQYLICSVIN
ncbi:hypothetical protein DW910_10560 [Bacteroides eggerthii]|nr:hypothetical protein DW910_10560 [Bacteroides eggerthii]